MYKNKIRTTLTVAAAIAASVSCSLAFTRVPEERFRLTQAVFEHFHVPADVLPASILHHLDLKQSKSGVFKALPFLDPSGSSFTYAQIQKSISKLNVYRDRYSKAVDDFQVKLRDEAESSYAEQSQVRHSLQGMRIALDPGHVGGEPWDERNQKFVDDEDGNRLSEGILNLQIALLLEAELKALGAEVFVTRRDLLPVTNIPYEDFDLKEFALKQFRNSEQTDWFQKTLAGDRDDLFRRFSESPHVMEIFSEKFRSRYFFQMADLDARVAAIEKFHPDLALIIHLDTRDVPFDGVKAYVPGGFAVSEFASREDRAYFAYHLIETHTWERSVVLSRELVHSITQKLNISTDSSEKVFNSVDLNSEDGYRSVKIEDGVFARNLNLTRRLTDFPVSYLECLFYSDPLEFRLLSEKTFSMTIGNKRMFYSGRLKLLVDALRDGLNQYVKR